MSSFPPWPLGWCVLARSRDITHRPRGVELFGRRLVCYRTPTGEPIAMDAACWHMGADLSTGRIIGDQIQCPFHGWRFGQSGLCEHIPAGSPIPARARQRMYLTAESLGNVFVFPDERPSHPLPFFEGADPSDLVAAPPFEFTIACPWWLVGTNGFDLQHFAGAHDRRLIGDAQVTTPHPMARRIVATFGVSGKSWRDRLTRRFAGPRVTMHVTVWAGSLAFVMAQFRDAPSNGDVPRTISYGMTEIRPVSRSDPDAHPRSLVRVTIFTRRRGIIGRLDARLRSRFIRAFLKPDARLLDRAVYRPDHLIAADEVMTDYLRWLASISSRSTPPRIAILKEQP